MHDCLQQDWVAIDHPEGNSWWRRTVRLALIVVVGCSGGLRFPECHAGRAGRPNILFLFADDLAFDAVASLGNEEVATPHIDAIARRGLTFTHAFNQGAWGGAVCVASRTMLITGRSLWHAHRDYDATEAKYVDTGKSWPQRLAATGYRTYFSGKWHVRADARKTFDVVRHVRPGMPNQTKQGYHRPVVGEADSWQPWDTQHDGYWKGGKHWSEVLADDGIAFLTEAATHPNQPFFMYLAFNAPHDPRQSPREYVTRYEVDQIRIPSSFRAEYPYEIGCNRIRDEVLAPFPRTHYAVQVHRQEYYAIITHMDDQIGRILDALEATGQRDNTIICFTADHGLAVGRHGLMGKQNMYEHSLRVPFMLAGPGIPSNQSNDQPIYLQQIMPTTLEWAGANLSDEIEFGSLGSQLRAAEGESHGRPIYGAYTKTQRMVRAEGYKLIVYPQIDTMRLYNLRLDSDELHDVIDHPSSGPIVERLLRRLKTLQGEMGDTVELVPGWNG